MTSFSTTTRSATRIVEAEDRTSIELNEGSMRTVDALTSVVTLGTDGNDTINLTGNKVVAFGGYGNDTINGTARNEVLLGGYGNDTLNSGGGNDYIMGGAGDDFINGGTGTDTVVYEFLDAVRVNQKALTITKMSAGTFKVDGGTFEGTDTLTNVEQIRIVNPYNGGEDWYINMAKLDAKAVGSTFSVSIGLNNSGAETMLASIVGVMKADAIHVMGGFDAIQ